jgi:hypothetical protein
VQGDFDIERPGSEDSDVEFRMGKDENSKNNSYRQLVVFSVLVSDYLDVGFIFNSLFDVEVSLRSLIWTFLFPPQGGTKKSALKGYKL